MPHSSEPSILEKKDNQQHVNEVQCSHKPTRDGRGIEYLEGSRPSSKAVAILEVNQLRSKIYHLNREEWVWGQVLL